MRILYYAYSLSVGGAETVVAQYLQKLRQEGAEVLLVQDTYTDSFLTRELEAQGIPIVTLWKGGTASKLGQTAKRAARGIGLYRTFNRAIRNFRPDIIHFHAFPDHMDRLEFPRERMFFTFHSELSRNLRLLGEGNQALLQKCADNGLSFCALTEACQTEIREIFHTDRVFYVPNGIDFQAIRSRRYSREDIAARFGIQKNRFLVGSVGRLHPVKNHERMLSIFRKVKDLRPDAVLLLVGGDMEGRMDKLRTLAARLGLEDAVIFTGERPDADQILSAMDCFLLTSLSESFSLVSIEAQALDVTCVLSDAVPESVACQNCVRLSLEAPDERWAEAVVGAESVPTIGNLENYDLNAVVDRLMQIYRDTLAKKRS